MPPLGPHMNLEFASKTFLALPPVDVNNTTLPASDATGQLGVDIRGFDGDLYIINAIGAVAAGAILTFQLQDAVIQTGAVPPDETDYVNVKDTAAALIVRPFTDAEDNSYKIERIDRHLIREFVRIQCDNAAAFAALCTSVFLMLNPKYEDQLSERIAGALTFTTWK